MYTPYKRDRGILPSKRKNSNVKTKIIMFVVKLEEILFIGNRQIPIEKKGALVSEKLDFFFFFFFFFFFLYKVGQMSKYRS